MSRVIARAALAAILVSGSAARADDAAPAAHYASGTMPASFDFYVSRLSKGYDLNGETYDFDGLIEALKRAGGKSVLAQGLTSDAQVQCAAIMGLESGSSVFVVDKNGRPKALNWTADEAGAAKARKACHEGR